MDGMVTVPYSNGVSGWDSSGLCADGTGGVKADTAGQKFMVVDTDTTNQMVTFVL